MTRPTDALRLVPSRDDGLTVGRAILEAHSQWEKEHGVTGAQNPWQEQHIILLGQAAILAAPASPLPEGGGDMDWQSVAMWMGFSASVIKSGEPWSDQCQQHYDEAKAAFARLAAPTSAK